MKNFILKIINSVDDETYKYSDDLDIVLKYTTKKIVQRMKNNEFPFDKETIKKYYEQYLEMTNKK